MAAITINLRFAPGASATSCVDYQIIFARGSGESLNDDNFQSFKAALEPELLSAGLSFEFYELGSSAQGGSQYPAVSVANFKTLLGAKISAGRSHEYGESVAQGTGELKSYIQGVSAACEETHFVLAGYSQGAQVISSSLPQLPTDKITYAATLGDPKLYLPEGISLDGATPPACLGLNYSDYRANVPDCKVSSGILEANVPYRPSSFKAKVGAWCNYADFMCGSKFDFSDLLAGHTAYRENGSFTEIAEHVASAIRAEHPDVKVAAKDLAILFDATDTATKQLTAYQKLIKDLETAATATGGQVSVCVYGENYGTSATSSIYTALTSTSWQENSHREILLLSDGPYQEEAKDPSLTTALITHLASLNHVSISALAAPEYQKSYRELVSATGGKLSTLELPETESAQKNLTISPSPELNLIISPKNAQNLSLVIINDAILGFTSQTNLTITNLSAGDKVTIIPIGADGYRAAAESYYYDPATGLGGAGVLKAPNSGAK